MTWIRVETSISDNPKIGRFAGDIGVDIHKAVGHLVAVWGKIAIYRPDGTVGDLEDESLESWSGWRKPKGLFAKMFRKHFVEDGELSGWRERQGKLVERALSEKRRKRGEPLPDADRFVYAIQRPSDLAIKIGVSRNPPFRMKELNGMVGEELVMLGFAPGNYDLERKAHVELSGHRHGWGEWFDHCQPVVQWLSDHGITTARPRNGASA